MGGAGDYTYRRPKGVDGVPASFRPARVPLAGTVPIDQWRSIDTDEYLDFADGKAREMRRRQLGAHVDFWQIHTKHIRAVPGYTGYVPNKEWKNVYGVSTGRHQMLSIDNVAEKETVKSVMDKANMPGYSGHVPLRQSITIGKRHHEATEDSITEWERRRLNVQEAKPRRHSGGVVMPNGWWGNASHHQQHGKIGEDTGHMYICPKHYVDPREKPKSEGYDPLNWHTGVIARLR